MPKGCYSHTKFDPENLKPCNFSISISHLLIGERHANLQSFTDQLIISPKKKATQFLL